MSFSDALAALVFVFMIVTAGFVLQLADARQKAKDSEANFDQQIERYTKADDQQREIIAELAELSSSCLRKGLNQYGVTVDADQGAGRLSLFLPGAGWFADGAAMLANDQVGGADTISLAIQELRGCLQIALQERSKKFRIRVTFEGHTDVRGTGGTAFPTNWELSAARGAALLRRFRCIGEDCSPPDLPRVEFVAAGYADSLVASRVLCEGEPGRPAPRRDIVLSETCDAAVCAWLDEHGHDELPTPEATAALSDLVTGFLDNRACTSDRDQPEAPSTYSRVDDALSAWANAIPLCKAADPKGGTSCALRWSRLRRVDVRIEVMPRKTGTTEGMHDPSTR